MDILNLKRANYKRTGGNTTTLRNHLRNKHPTKLEPEVETPTGEMDKFVTKDIPVSVYLFFFFSFYIIFFLY